MCIPSLIGNNRLEMTTFMRFLNFWRKYIHSYGTHIAHLWTWFVSLLRCTYVPNFGDQIATPTHIHIKNMGLSLLFSKPMFFLIDEHSCLNCCISTKASQIVCIINVHILICQHEKWDCRLWKVLCSNASILENFHI